jgi:hypothetical protein
MLQTEIASEGAWERTWPRWEASSAYHVMAGLSPPTNHRRSEDHRYHYNTPIGQIIIPRGQRKVGPESFAHPYGSGQIVS